MNETMDTRLGKAIVKLCNTGSYVVRRYMYKNHRPQLQTAKGESTSARHEAGQAVLQAVWSGLCSGTLPV